MLVRTPIVNDALDENVESFTLTATRTAGPTTNASAIGTATITDDDAPPTFTINDVTVNEGAGTATFTVTLDGPSGLPVSVNYVTGDVTAHAGADYMAKSGTLNFAPGVTSRTVTVSILDDTVFESSESFDLILSAATNATIADATGTATILDDGMGSGATDNDRPAISVSSPTVTEGVHRHAVFTVRLSNASTTPISFDLSMVNVTTTAADCGPTLEVSFDGGATWTVTASATIAAGNTTVLVRTPIADDALVESTESFSLTATVTAGPTRNTASKGTGTIVDNDSAPPVPPADPPPFIPPSAGFVFGYDSFSDFSNTESESERMPMAIQFAVRSIDMDRPALLPLAPIYSGEADPGATLVVDIYNAKGEHIGSQTVVADSGGNWLATFPTTTLRDSPNTARITQFAPTYSMNERWGNNLRTYFTPALNAGHFSLDVRGGADLTGEAAPLLSGLQLEDPLQLGAVKYGGEFLTRQATANGY